MTGTGPVMASKNYSNQWWEASFQELVDYKRFHGDYYVPQKYKADPQLGRWVARQRHGNSTMNEERRKRLNSIGFTWKVCRHQLPLNKQQWETRFQELVEYKRVHRNYNVSTLDKVNSQLGNWVNTQRNCCHHHF